MSSRRLKEPAADRADLGGKEEIQQIGRAMGGILVPLRPEPKAASCRGTAGDWIDDN